MPKRWHVRPHDAAAVAAIERSAGVSSIVAALLVGRGITNSADVQAFLAGSLSQLRDPETLPGVPEAADRILAAVKAGRPIVIYGDYDADGMTGTAILVGCLETLDAAPRWFVPNRFEEGYGLSIDALERLAAEGASLVVTVDCGIASVAEALRARELGLELVVTDHHTFADTLPEADVLVHPRLPGTAYPFGELSGAGVAFKLAWAIATRASGAKQVTPRLREMLLRGVGLAAFGTVADMVPLLDENRILVRQGLECLRSRGGPGIDHLMTLLKLKHKAALDAEDIAFGLGPTLNAAGRFGEAAKGIELLTTDDPTRAESLASYLVELNTQRKSEERSMLVAATKLAVEAFDPEADAALVLAERGWNSGIVGLVAGKLADRFHRPAVVIARGAHEGLVATGSARSVPGFDIHAALMACRHLVLTCGGHPAAAGLRVEDRRIDEFREAFVAAVASRMPDELRRGSLSLDGETTLAGVTLRSIEEIERLAPFGQGNRRPVLCASRVNLAAPPRTMGQGGNHLSFELVQHGGKIRGVAWGAAEWLPHLPPPGQPFHIAFKPKVNDHGGFRKAELEVIDWRPDGVDVGIDVPMLATTAS